MKNFYILSCKFSKNLRKSLQRKQTKSMIYTYYGGMKYERKLLESLSVWVPIAASMLVGCSSGGAANEAVTLSEGDTVKIGLNYELSGNVATYGQAMNKATELAIKQYNRKRRCKIQS